MESPFIEPTSTVPIFLALLAIRRVILVVGRAGLRRGPVVLLAEVDVPVAKSGGEGRDVGAIVGQGRHTSKTRFQTARTAAVGNGRAGDWEFESHRVGWARTHRLLRRRRNRRTSGGARWRTWRTPPRSSTVRRGEGVGGGVRSDVRSRSFLAPLLLAPPRNLKFCALGAAFAARAIDRSASMDATSGPRRARALARTHSRHRGGESGPAGAYRGVHIVVLQVFDRIEALRALLAKRFQLARGSRSLVRLAGSAARGSVHDGRARLPAVLRSYPRVRA